MIDLHTHTTASDGRCSPAELVARAAAAGVGVLSVTDHDTVAGCEPTAAACAAAPIEFVPGIEITAVRDVDVHTLGYFMDVASPALAQFCLQREDGSQVRAMVELLSGFGIAARHERDSETGAGGPVEIRRPAVGRAPLVGQDTFRPSATRSNAGSVMAGPRLFAKSTTPEAVIRRCAMQAGSSIAHPGPLGHDGGCRPSWTRVSTPRAYHSNTMRRPHHDAWRGEQVGVLR